MTVEQIGIRVYEESYSNLTCTNLHGITLKQALVEPQRLKLIVRRITNGHIADEIIDAWFIGQEDEEDGYRIVLSDDGLKFGLASPGFPSDQYPVLDGWYGSLAAAFMGM